jgi:hypothetical protein
MISDVNVDQVNIEIISRRKKDRRLVEGVLQETNVQIASTIKNVQEQIEPIIGYAAEPLLPLIEACAPLVKIILDLSTYIQLAINGTPREPPDDLTFDESAAIRLYTMEWKEPHSSLYSNRIGKPFVPTSNISNYFSLLSLNYHLLPSKLSGVG